MSSDQSCAFAGSRIQKNNKCSYDSQLKHHIETFSDDINKCFNIDKVYNTTLTVARFNDETLTCQEGIETLLSPGLHTPQDSNPGTSFVVSPTSSPLTPRSHTFTWESPQTPLRPSHHAGFGFSTPLTPPTTLEGVLKTSSFADKFTQMMPSPVCAAGDDKSNATEQTQDVKSFPSKIRTLLTTHKPHTRNDFHESSDNLIQVPIVTLKREQNDIGDSDGEEYPTGFNPIANPAIRPVVSIADGEYPEFSVTFTQKNLNRHDVSDYGSPSATTLGTKEIGYVQEGESTEDCSPLLPLPKLQFNYQSLTNKSALHPPMAFNIKPFVGPFSDLGPSLDITSFQKRDSPVVMLHIGTKGINSQPGAGNSKKSQKVVQAANKLRKVLEHILPFDIHTRLNDNLNGCVATEVAMVAPCSRERQGRRNVINASLEAIRTCIDSSDYFALPGHIEKLVALVTCSRHRDVALSEEVAQPRMKTLRNLIANLTQNPEEIVVTFGKWLQAISNGAPTLLLGSLDSTLRTTWTASLSMLLNHIMPVEMQKRVDEKPARCVVIGCKEPHSIQSGGPKEKRCVIDGKIEIITQCVKELTYVNLPVHFESLVQAVMCQSHRVIANSNIKMLDAIVPNLAHLSDQYYFVFKAWISAIAKCDLPTFPQAITAPTSSASGPATALLTTGISKVDFRSTASPHFSKFAPYQAEFSSDLAILEALRSKALKPLTKDEMTNGFIYIFWDQINFGKVKIGKTVNLERRLKEWDRQCKIKHHYHQSSQTGKLAEIPHVKRIERLMHIELVNFRKEKACQGCGKTHIEWFDVNEAQVVEVFQKWHDWIVQKPYAQDHAGKWTIRPEMLETLSEVCKPTKFSGGNGKEARPPRERAKGIFKLRTTQRSR